MNTNQKILLAVAVMAFIFAFCAIKLAVDRNYELEKERIKNGVKTEPLVFMDSVMKYSSYKFMVDSITAPPEPKVEEPKPSRASRLVLEYEENVNGTISTVRFSADAPNAEERAAMYSVFDMEVTKIRANPIYAQQTEINLNRDISPVFSLNP